MKKLTQRERRNIYRQIFERIAYAFTREIYYPGYDNGINRKKKNSFSTYMRIQQLSKKLQEK